MIARSKGSSNSVSDMENLYPFADVYLFSGCQHPAGKCTPKNSFMSNRLILMVRVYSKKWTTRARSAISGTGDQPIFLAMPGQSCRPGCVHAGAFLRAIHAAGRQTS